MNRNILQHGRSHFAESNPDILGFEMGSVDRDVSPQLHSSKSCTATKCPSCQHCFSYRKGFDESQFPLLLKCGHSMCFQCVTKNIGHATQLVYVGCLNGPSQPENCATDESKFPSRCAVCQTPMTDQLITELSKSGRESFKAEDVLRAYPLDFFTLGWLAVLENFPLDVLPNGEITDTVEIVQEEDTKLAPNGLDETDSLPQGKQCCGQCGKPEVHIYCRTTSQYLCLYCRDDRRYADNPHDHHYLAHDGQILGGNPCHLHGKTKVFSDPVTRQMFCLDCKTAGNLTNLEDVRSRNSKVMSELGPITKLAKRVDKAITESSRAVEALAEQLTKNGRINCRIYSEFMYKLQASFQNLRHKYLTNLDEIDGKRLSLLDRTESAMEQQLQRLEFLAHKMEFVVQKGKTVRDTDLEKELDAIIDEIKTFGLFDEGCVDRVCSGRINREKLDSLVLDEEMSAFLRPVLNEISSKTEFSAEVKNTLDTTKVGDLLEQVENETRSGRKRYTLKEL